MNYKLIFFLYLSIGFFSASGRALDSLRVEQKNGKKYIIHEVQPKESLYAIGKKYNVAVGDIIKANNNVADGLQIYQEIRVPLMKKRKPKKPILNPLIAQKMHLVKQGETLFGIAKKYNMSVDSITQINKLPHLSINIGDTLLLDKRMISTIEMSKVQPEKEKIERKVTPDSLYHIVQQSETLFAIAQSYQVEIKQLQVWNQLTGYKLSIGQKLKIKSDAVANKIIPKKVAEVKIDQEEEQKPIDTLYITTNRNPFKTKITKTDSTTIVEEQGFAMKIADTGYSKKFLTLHRSAPLGTEIKVKNEMTQHTIKARVVGRLPENKLNQSLLIRLSEAAFNALGALDAKMPIQTSYAR